MLEIQKISVKELEYLVDLAYSGDNDLLDKFHVKKFTQKQAVESTMNMVREAAEVKELSYYKVTNDKVAIGYFITFDDFLYSFGFNKKHREENILKAWWEAVKSVLGEDFFAGVLKNNVRAIRFLEKCGMEIYNGFDDELPEDHVCLITI